MDLMAFCKGPRRRLAVDDQGLCLSDWPDRVTKHFSANHAASVKIVTIDCGPNRIRASVFSAILTSVTGVLHV